MEWNARLAFLNDRPGLMHARRGRLFLAGGGFSWFSSSMRRANARPLGEEEEMHSLVPYGGSMGALDLADRSDSET